MPDTKKSNEFNGLEKCPRGSDVGPLGEANAFAQNLTSSLVFNMAIEELIKDEEIVRAALADDPDSTDLLAELAEVEAKWLLAMALFQQPA